jgi:hypothetical protein
VGLEHALSRIGIRLYSCSSNHALSERNRLRVGGRMEPFSSLLVGALTAGAAAFAKDVASDGVKDAYLALKALLIDTYKFVSVELLESAPGNQAFQKAAEAEAKQKDGLAADAQVINRTAALQDALLNVPLATLQAWGVDVQQIKAGRDAIFRNVSGSTGGVRAHIVEAARDAVFENIHGGTPPGKT